MLCRLSRLMCDSSSSSPEAICANAKKFSFNWLNLFACDELSNFRKESAFELAFAQLPFDQPTRKTNKSKSQKIKVRQFPSSLCSRIEVFCKQMSNTATRRLSRARTIKLHFQRRGKVRRNCACSLFWHVCDHSWAKPQSIVREAIRGLQNYFPLFGARCHCRTRPKFNWRCISRKR